MSANLRREWRLEAQHELEAACAVAYANGRRSCAARHGGIVEAAWRGGYVSGRRSGARWALAGVALLLMVAVGLRGRGR